MRSFCSDKPTEEAILTLRDWLKGQIAAGDTVSVSLLARRAIRLYQSHVAAMAPQEVEQEKIEVRKGSRLPTANPHKRACKRPCKSK